MLEPSSRAVLDCVRSRVASLLCLAGLLCGMPAWISEKNSWGTWKSIRRSRVEQGALLVKLDPELGQLALERARAATREARAKLADSRRRLRNAEQLSAQEALAETQLLSLQAEVRIDEAALERLGAEERREAALLERHSILAPFAGTVSERLANAGEWIEPGTAVVELVSTRDLRIDFQVPQEFFSEIHAGMPLGVRLDSVPDQTIAARVSATVPLSDARARTFLLLARLEGAGAPMIPGMSARATLRLGSGREGVVVPRDALLRYPDGRITVWVLEDAREGGAPVVSERRVRTGRAFGGDVEITDGLEPGTRVVVRGNEGLREGQHVRVQQTPGAGR
jgi:RND family efflux transporter MFP subunit